VGTLSFIFLGLSGGSSSAVAGDATSSALTSSSAAARVGESRREVTVAAAGLQAGIVTIRLVGYDTIPLWRPGARGVEGVRCALRRWDADAGAAEGLAPMPARHATIACLT
jgi:hypothetical protein